METARKRPRSANWDEKEKLAFLTIVKNHLPIVEDKNKTIICNKKKDEAWMEIQQYMNQIGYKRDAYRLREQWLRMKAQAKKAIKTYHKVLGEGRADVMPPTSIDYMIRDIVPQEFLDDDENAEDPDTTVSQSGGSWQNTYQPQASPDGDENDVDPDAENDISELKSSGPIDGQECPVIDVDCDNEKVEETPAVATNEGETTDTAEASDGVSPRKKEKSREETNSHSDSVNRSKKARPLVRQMSYFEMATLELNRMKTEAAMRHDSELHKVKIEAALWERRFWEAKLLRVRGYRL